LVTLSPGGDHVKKELNGGMDSSVSDAVTEKQNSADLEYSEDNQAKNKIPDFVISSDQMPC
jgi:hypothetical protein